MNLSTLEYVELINESVPFYRGARDVAQDSVATHKPFLWRTQDWTIYLLGVSETQRIFKENKNE